MVVILTQIKECANLANVLGTTELLPMIEVLIENQCNRCNNRCGE